MWIPHGSPQPLISAPPAPIAVVVHFYSWLLQGYVSNAPLTNHALLRFLQRLADPQGLDLEPMLYQVRLKLTGWLAGAGQPSSSLLAGEWLSWWQETIVKFFQSLCPPPPQPCDTLLLQLSTLRLFHAILADTALRRSPTAEPLLHFVTRVVRNLFQR